MTADDDLLAALAKLLPKPADSAGREAKQAFSQRVSDATAMVLARGLLARGLTGTYPVAAAGARAGAERRLAGASAPSG